VLKWRDAGDNLVVTPALGSFDAAAIRQWLVAAPDVLVDPLGEDAYMLCGLPQCVPPCYRHRVANERRFPYTVLVVPGEDEVVVLQECGDAHELRSALSLLRWLTGRWRCRISEHGFSGLVDKTGQVAENGVESLYPLGG
jgi:hypothetical protein